MKDNKTILLVEDDQVDIMTVKRALKKIQVTNPIAEAHNGEEALDYLRAHLNHKPGIILLDINMPKMNGIEFLGVIKEDKDLKLIPVIMLTTSKEDQDRLSSFNLQVAGYMIKPVDFSQFLDVMKAIDSYWTLSELAN
ncbi:MAG TPA: response regulator [Spirochaetes bacterium]|nr:response regulator [Spirochaetota bacterium]